MSKGLPQEEKKTALENSLDYMNDEPGYEEGYWFAWYPVMTEEATICWLRNVWRRRAKGITVYHSSQPMSRGGAGGKAYAYGAGSLAVGGQGGDGDTGGAGGAAYAYGPGSRAVDGANGRGIGR